MQVGLSEKRQRKCADILICILHLLVLSVSVQKYFLFFILLLFWASAGSAILVGSLLIKSRRRMACDDGDDDNHLLYSPHLNRLTELLIIIFSAYDFKWVNIAFFFIACFESPSKWCIYSITVRCSQLLTGAVGCQMFPVCWLVLLDVRCSQFVDWCCWMSDVPSLLTGVVGCLISPVCWLVLLDVRGPQLTGVVGCQMSPVCWLVLLNVRCSQFVDWCCWMSDVPGLLTGVVGCHVPGLSGGVGCDVRG